MTTRGLSVIIPAWGELDIVSNSVLSAVRQWAPSDSKYPKYEVVIVDDWIEGRREDGTSPYDYYLSDEFKKLYDTNRVEVNLILNDEHKYQGESREIGYQEAKYNYFVLLDCDDMLAPNCLYRYYEIIENESKNKPIAFVAGNLLSFDKNDYHNKIPGSSIWVQGRCYNRDFLNKHEVHFLTGLYSRQGEDYPWINKLDFAARHDEGYQTIVSVPESEPFAYWFPNYNSLSRQDPHYGSHLSGWTLHSSLSILEYMKWFCDEYGMAPADDEEYKQKCLGMNIRAMYSLLHFIFEASVDKEWKPKEGDWEELTDNCKKLKEAIKPLWTEIVPSNIYEAQYAEKNMSDMQFVESWLGDFNNYIENDWDILNMTTDEMLEYAHTLKFDEAMHEENASYVQAFKERHISSSNNKQ